MAYNALILRQICSTSWFAHCRSRLGMVGKKGGKDCGQKKITGFFAKPPSSKRHDLEAKHQKIVDGSITRRRINSEDDEVDGRGVLEDVTNALEDSLQSPAKVVPPEDSEVIERTPEINPNRLCHVEQELVEQDGR